MCLLFGCLADSVIAAQRVCEQENKCAMGSSFSPSDWIPVKTLQPPRPTQLLPVGRHQLHFRSRTHAACDIREGCRYARTRLARRHIYLRGRILFVFFPRPETLNLLYVYSHTYNIRGPPVIKENTPIISIMMCCALLKCRHQNVCRVLWNRGEGSRSQQSSVCGLSCVPFLIVTACVCEGVLFLSVYVSVKLQLLYNVVAEVIGRRVLTVTFGVAVVWEQWGNSCC